MMEDFSGLALPPLFGGRILEAELELGPGGGPGPERERDRDRERDDAQMHRSKCQALSRSCRDIEQVNEKILGRLHQVQRLTRRLRKERRFLMKTLDSYGDDYRTAQLTIPLEDEGKALEAALGVEEDGSSPAFPQQSAAGLKKKRHRLPKERERDAQMESEQLVLTEGPFTGFPSPSSLSH